MKILFIGSINLGNTPNGGEEYKNQLLFSKIQDNFRDRIIIDTYKWLKKPKIWYNLITSLLFKKPETILISASSVSTYRLLKLIWVFRRSVMHKVTYLVIGGYFPEGIKEKRFNWRIYQDLKNIIVEGESLKQNLHLHSELKNISVISNFKTFPDVALRRNENLSNIFRFVFVGRISKGKGVKEILGALEKLTRSQNHFEVHFYGPIEEKLNLETDKSKYCGFLDFQNHAEKAYSTLSEYDCMLFPTYWMGEGFPGVIIDAFVAGLPVIATDWNMNTEFIENGVNGFIIEPKSTVDLAEKMLFVMRNKEKLDLIRRNNLARAKDYHIDKIWPKLKSHVVS